MDETKVKHGRLRHQEFEKIIGGIMFGYLSIE